MSGYAIRDVGIAGEIDRLAKDILELKNTQLYRSSSLKTYASTSAAIESVPVIQFGQYTNEGVYKRITFTAANQKNPFGRLAIDIRKFDVNTPALNSDPPRINTYNFIPTQENDGKLQWIVDVSAPANYKFFVYYKVAASDYGTFTIEDVVF
jgi:hypothetical protein